MDHPTTGHISLQQQALMMLAAEYFANNHSLKPYSRRMLGEAVADAVGVAIVNAGITNEEVRRRPDGLVENRMRAALEELNVPWEAALESLMGHVHQQNQGLAALAAEYSARGGSLSDWTKDKLGELAPVVIAALEKVSKPQSAGEAPA